MQQLFLSNFVGYSLSAGSVMRFIPNSLRAYAFLLQLTYLITCYVLIHKILIKLTKQNVSSHLHNPILKNVYVRRTPLNLFPDKGVMKVSNFQNEVVEQKC